MNIDHLRRLMSYRQPQRKRKPQRKSSRAGSSDSSGKESEIPCGVKGCDGFSDKHVGGRSLGMDDARDMWGDSGVEMRKGRVRVCKSCYRKWKKETKDDPQY